MLRRVALITLSLALVSAGAEAKPITGKKARFSRCPKSAKSLVECPDILYHDSGDTFDFQLKHRDCDLEPLDSPGTWSLYPALVFKHGKVNQTFVYDNLPPGNEASPGFNEITFHIKGGFVTQKRLKLKITGRFTKDNSNRPDCAKARINETHVLTVGFQN
jgi:hypothetical protein